NYLGNFLLYTIPLTSSLALAFHSRARRIAIASIAISIAALIFSGTRGAWLGLIVGAIVFVMLALKARPGEDEDARDRLARDKDVGPAASDGGRLRFKGAKVIVVVAVLLAAAVIVALSPVSRNVGVRARSLMTDRFTGSGRTLLWRDSLRMAADFVLIGC